MHPNRCHCFALPATGGHLPTVLRRARLVRRRFADIGDALLVDGDNFDAAILSTPTFAHLEAIQLGPLMVALDHVPMWAPRLTYRVYRAWSSTASNARKHIMVEKPVCEDVGDIAKAFAAANDANVALFCSFQRRFDRSYRRVKEAVANGDIGVPQLVRMPCCTRVDSPPIPHSYAATYQINVAFRDHPTPPIKFLVTGGGASSTHADRPAWLPCCSVLQP